MGCSLASSLLLVATNAAGWVSALSVLVFGAPTMLILLAELARPVEWKESRLRAFRNLAFGARNGFVVGVLIFISMFFVKLILSPDGGPPISSFTLFITGLLAFAFSFFCDWIVSAFDFRLWMGDRSLDQVEIEDLFQSWEWEKTSQRWRRRGYFASSFWTLVPFFLRNKNDIRSIPPWIANNYIPHRSRDLWAVSGLARLDSTALSCEHSFCRLYWNIFRILQTGARSLRWDEVKGAI